MNLQTPLAGEGFVAIVAGEAATAVNVFPMDVEGADGSERLGANVAASFFALVRGGDVAFQIFGLERFTAKGTHLLLQSSG